MKNFTCSCEKFNMFTIKLSHYYNKYKTIGTHLYRFLLGKIQISRSELNENKTYLYRTDPRQNRHQRVKKDCVSAQFWFQQSKSVMYTDYSIWISIWTSIYIYMEYLLNMDQLIIYMGKPLHSSRANPDLAACSLGMCGCITWTASLGKIQL